MVRLCTFRGFGEAMEHRGVLHHERPTRRLLAPLVLEILQATDRPLSRNDILGQLAASGNYIRPTALSVCLYRMRCRRLIVQRPAPNGNARVHYVVSTISR